MSWLEMLGLFLSDSLPYGADVGTGFNMIPLFRTSLLIHTNTHTHRISSAFKYEYTAFRRWRVEQQKDDEAATRRCAGQTRQQVDFFFLTYMTFTQNMFCFTYWTDFQVCWRVDWPQTQTIICDEADEAFSSFEKSGISFCVPCSFPSFFT